MPTYAAPGALFEVTVYNLPTGLVGTLGARLMDGATQIQARTTAGIVELVAGLGAYRYTGTAPEVRGAYQVLFDDGSGTPAGAAVVDLVVTSSTPDAPASDGNLTTLAAVKEQMETETTAADDVIETLIGAASQAIIRHLGRRLILEDGADDRYFDERDAYDHDQRELWVWDLSAAPTEVEILDAAADTVAELTVASDLVVVPRNREAWQPVERIRFRAGVTGPLYGQEVRVRGVWGWPAIPSDIAQAAIITVRAWLRAAPSTLGSYDDSFGVAAVPAPAGGWMLPMAAKQLLKDYRARGVA